MARPWNAQNTPADVCQLIEQLERHCLAPDGSYLSKSAYSELHLAREEMSRERLRYLEALAVYGEAIRMIEEYQQAVSSANHGGVRDHLALYPHFGLTCSPQVYESLEHRLTVAEAAQRLRLPLLSKDGDIHEEEIEKWNTMSRSSLDSASSITLSLSSISTGNNNNYADNSSVSRIVGPPPSISDNAELGVGGVPNRFLGITPSFLCQSQPQQATMAVNPAEYQRSIVSEIESRLEAKCDTLADIFTMDEIDSSSISQISGARLPERKNPGDSNLSFRTMDGMRGQGPLIEQDFERDCRQKETIQIIHTQIYHYIPKKIMTQDHHGNCRFYLLCYDYFYLLIFNVVLLGITSVGTDD